MTILAKNANGDIQMVTFFMKKKNLSWSMPQIMSWHIKSATHAIEAKKICQKHNLNAWNLPQSELAYNTSKNKFYDDT